MRARDFDSEEGKRVRAKNKNERALKQIERVKAREKEIADAK